MTDEAIGERVGIPYLAGPVFLELYVAAALLEEATDAFLLFDESRSSTESPCHLNCVLESDDIVAKAMQLCCGCYLFEGVQHWTLDADKHENDPELEKIRDDHEYSYQDVITVSPDTLSDYEEKIESFFEEHMHSDDEIRYILEGSGYFDIRSKDESWIRIKMGKGDMITLPAGIYHRFTLDDSNYIKAMRLFVGEPIWTPLSRPQDNHPVRKDYAHKIALAV